MAEWRLLSDGRMFLPAEAMFATAPADQRGDGADIPCGCLLIRTATDTVLVDTGLGAYEHPLGGRGGELEAALAAEDVKPDDVDVVVVTHGHLDHIGGLCRDGEPRFARARHVIARVEWDWNAQHGSAIADEQLPPLQRAGVLELVDPPAEPVSGIRLLPARPHARAARRRDRRHAALPRRRDGRPASRRASGVDDGVR
jgi:glyoxylase-like metal-dependent hydrolase (beta-lactamase superfamily II)